jgi:hypothetical protein
MVGGNGINGFAVGVDATIGGIVPGAGAVAAAAGVGNGADTVGTGVLGGHRKRGLSFQRRKMLTFYRNHAASDGTRSTGRRHPVDNLTIRLRWYSGPSLFGLGMMVFLAVLVFVGKAGRGLLGVEAILVIGWVISMFATKVEVTPTDVRLSIWLLPRRSAPRDAIRAMHWYGRSFTFVDDDHRVLLKVASLGFTRGQLLDLSEALGVRLYNHRTKRGLGSDVWKGQLMQRANSARP